MTVWKYLQSWCIKIFVCMGPFKPQNSENFRKSLNLAKLMCSQSYNVLSNGIAIVFPCSVSISTIQTQNKHTIIDHSSRPRPANACVLGEKNTGPWKIRNCHLLQTTKKHYGSTREWFACTWWDKIDGSVPLRSSIWHISVWPSLAERWRAVSPPISRLLTCQRDQHSIL